MGSHLINQAALVAGFCAALVACSDSSFSGSTSQQKTPPPAPPAAAAPGAETPVAHTPTSADGLPKTGGSANNGDTQLGTTGALNGEGTNSGATTGAPGSGVGTNAVPANAVTQGSFTAWAQPSNPQAGQDYQIFIQVSLPSSAQGYVESDLSGSLQGTDGYTQSLSDSDKTSGPGTPNFTVQNHTALLSEWVPGAADHVNDTVQVHSNLLNESQTITITFQ